MDIYLDFEMISKLFRGYTPVKNILEIIRGDLTVTLRGKIATADDLLLALYRASSELPVGEFQGAALELIKPLLPFDSGWWGSGVMTAESALSIHALYLHDLLTCPGIFGPKGI